MFTWLLLQCHVSRKLPGTICCTSIILFSHFIRDKLWAWTKRRTILPSLKTERRTTKWGKNIVPQWTHYLRPLVYIYIFFLPHAENIQSQRPTALDHYILTNKRVLYCENNRVKSWHRSAHHMFVTCNISGLYLKTNQLTVMCSPVYLNCDPDG